MDAGANIDPSDILKDYLQHLSIVNRLIERPVTKFIDCEMAWPSKADTTQLKFL